MSAVSSVVVLTTSYVHPIITVQISFVLTASNPPDHLGLILIDQATGDPVDLSGVPYTPASPPMPALDPLDLSPYTSGTYSHTFSINVSTLPPGSYTVAVFAWPDGNFNEDYYIKEVATKDVDVVCLVAGTLVATPEGERPVETLGPGDMVLTADGRSVPVRFVGVQRVAPRFSRYLEAAPIRISAGALGGGLPRRDLLVSPGHSLFLAGTLVTAGALVNGSTICREPPGPEVITYYSIETERHELLLAEGVAVESFLDAVPRSVWHNYADYEAAYPEAPVIEELPYPRACSARQVPQAVRRMIAEAVPPPASQAA